MLTTQDIQWFDFRRELNDTESTIVEHAMDDLRAALTDAGIKAPNDDRAASLEAALVRYLIEARRP